MLKLEGVSISYGPIKALENISLNVEEGKITAVIGANGAGKSSLLSAISGLTTIEKGSISLNKSPIHDVQVEERVKSGIAHVIEGRRLFKDQTVHDNLLLGSTFRQVGTNSDEINRVYDRFPILKEKRNDLAGTLSGGQQQLLIISMAILSKPKLLLLDEPSLGLAPVIVQEVYEFLEELKGDGVSIVISEQLAALAFRIADYGYVLERGKLVEKGDVSYLKSLLDSDELSSVYLS